LNKLDIKTGKNNIIEIECPSEISNQCCLNRSNQSSSKKPLTDQEMEEIKRIMIKIPTLFSCHLRYLLGINNCKGIQEYIQSISKHVIEIKKSEVQESNINRYMDKNGWIVIYKPKSVQTKGKKEWTMPDNDRDQQHAYIP